MREQMEGAGYQVVSFQKAADVYVINTCTVTERAEQECRRLIRRVQRQNRNARIFITGCYAQLKGDDIAKIPGVTGVFGNSERINALRYIDNVNGTAEPLADIADISNQRVYEPFHLSQFANQTRAYLKIQDGCNLVCSFCAITTARGPNRSRPLADIVAEAKRLVDNGFQEIVLTGVHIESYGKDIKKIHTLTDVVRALLPISGLKRIRFGSLGPLSLTDEFLALCAENPEICAHFHVSLQSGDNKILKAMRRPYRREWFVERLNRVVELMPHAGIGSDVMVGFPGETRTHFKNTFNLVDELPFSYLHVFPFSPRPDTRAAEMDEQIPEPIKAERSKILRALAQRKKRQFFQRFIGQKFDVMVENRRDRDGNLTGLTENYIRVSFPGPDSLMNEMACVRLDRAGKKQMQGTLADTPERYYFPAVPDMSTPIFDPSAF